MGEDDTRIVGPWEARANPLIGGWWVVRQGERPEYVKGQYPIADMITRRADAELVANALNAYQPETCTPKSAEQGPWLTVEHAKALEDALSSWRYACPESPEGQEYARRVEALLPRAKTAVSGAKTYVRRCSACHDVEGLTDGQCFGGGLHRWEYEPKGEVK